MKLLSGKRKKQKNKSGKNSRTGKTLDAAAPDQSPSRSDSPSEAEQATEHLLDLVWVETEAFDEIAAYNAIRDFCRSFTFPVSYAATGRYVFSERRKQNRLEDAARNNLDIVYELAEKESSDHSKDRVCRMIIRLRDYISLAKEQSDYVASMGEIYSAKIANDMATQIEKKEQDIENEVRQQQEEQTSQLLTLVGIFTALAFLLFGSMESLSGVFKGMDAPLLKLLCTCVVWGLGVMNMVFIFLFCVSKLTGRNTIASVKAPEATIFQKYPIVFWTNWVMVSLLIVFGWLYYLDLHDLGGWFNAQVVSHNVIIPVIGTCVIGGAIFGASVWLKKKTNNDAYERSELEEENAKDKKETPKKE